MLELPLHPQVTLLKSHPCGLLAVDKATNIRAHPNTRHQVDPEAAVLAPYDLEEECFYYTDSAGCAHKLHLLNRLDSATSGVLLLALEETVARKVRALFEEQRVKKTYFALVKGRPPAIPNLWTDRLQRTHSGNGHKIKITAATNRLEQTGQYAKTKIDYLGTDQQQLNLSLLRLMPITGRTHQLRVQCAKRGFPIAGDRQYGDFAFNRQIAHTANLKRLCLHAQAIQLHFNLNGRKIKFSARSPLPEVFLQLFPVRKDSDNTTNQPAKKQSPGRGHRRRRVI